MYVESTDLVTVVIGSKEFMIARNTGEELVIDTDTKKVYCLVDIVYQFLLAEQEEKVA